jgi:hypothetical protein
MNTLIVLIGASFGGWIGWAIGGLVSFWVAFLLSAVGTGVGVYFARRFIREYGR